jgi:NTE family protein
VTRSKRVTRTTGVVISGGGARGAYEAGLLSVVLPRLLEEDGDQRFVVVGTSAGAINTALLCSHADVAVGIDRMLDFWLSASVQQLTKSIWLTGPIDLARYLAMVFSIAPTSFESVLDSRPLRETLDSRVNWRRLDQVVGGDGHIASAAVVATSSDSGRTIVFVAGAQSATLPPDDPSRNLHYARTSLRSEHVVASSAIPAMFRPVHITEPAALEGWYFDGGVRLNTPIKPALELGADRVVVVATTPDPDLPNRPSCTAARPDVFDSAASVLQAALVDDLTEDVRSLRRVNNLVEGAVDPPYRTVPNLYMGPPAGDLIGSLANEVYEDQFGGWQAALTDLGLLGRLMGAAATPARGELLSFMLFDGAFHQPLIDLGRKHAEILLVDGPGLPWQ